jgi:2-hydroxymuconate-semialdehyde hydrolase
MANENPEIGKTVDAGGIATNYHDVGAGFPLLMLHGSGPGVSAWANWRLTIPAMAKVCRVIAPDIVGFGFTARPKGIAYSMPVWIKHAVDTLDALDLAQVDILGNSFGGGLALALAIKHPDRVRKLVLMGSAGVGFKLTPGLDAVWGYEPSIENMRKLLDIFACDRKLVTDELAEMRYKASIRPGFHESYSSMFPAPRERWVAAMASRDEDIRKLPHKTLVIHGRDDRVVPLANSLKLHDLIVDSELHVFGRCGHWTQIEHAARFNKLVFDFLTGG